MNIKQATFLLIISSCQTVAAENIHEYQPHNDIITAATHLIETALLNTPDKTITINPLDVRLTLKKCSQPLHAFIPAGSKLMGRTTIGVSCEDKKPWKLFVSATITVYANIIVADEYIERGKVIQAQDIKSKRSKISTISRGYFTTIAQITGRIAKYPIHREQIIHPSSVKKPNLVKRGKEVIIQARSGGIVVKMRGTAISDATLGELVRIKNKHSRRVIQAEVIGTNLVEVSM